MSKHHGTHGHSRAEQFGHQHKRASNPKRRQISTVSKSPAPSATHVIPLSATRPTVTTTASIPLSPTLSGLFFSHLKMAGGGETHLHDLPEAILSNVFSMVEDTRTRNCMALVCRRWCTLERSTRSSLCLRGNVRDLFLLPTCFASVTQLDLSHLSPWGHPFLLHHHPHHHQHEHPTTEEQQQHHLMIALLLRRAFPNLTSLTFYARHPSTLQVLAPQWPGLRHAKLVRWHQRPPHHPHGADLAPLLAACPSLDSLDLSQFYCWAEDVPAALHAFPAAAASLARLDLLSPVAAHGSKLDSSYTKTVHEVPYNLSVLEIYAPIVFPGLLHAPSAASSNLTALLEKIY